MRVAATIAALFVSAPLYAKVACLKPLKNTEIKTLLAGRSVSLKTGDFNRPVAGFNFGEDGNIRYRFEYVTTVVPFEVRSNEVLWQAYGVQRAILFFGNASNPSVIYSVGGSKGVCQLLSFE